MPEKQNSPEKIVATNRKARHEYFILETYEAGIALKGTEVKSLRQGNASFADAYGSIDDGEVWLVGMHISPYKQGSYANVDPTRSRKLLLHASEIRKLTGRVKEKGLTLVPLRLYFKNNIVKVSLGLAKGKRAFDKRRDIAAREVERAVRQRYAR